MHKCINLGPSGLRIFAEEYSWSLALYIEINMARCREVIVCQHPSFKVVEDLERLGDMILSVDGDEIKTLYAVSEILDNVFPEWRRDFEVVIRRGSISISVYL